MKTLETRTIRDYPTNLNLEPNVQKHHALPGFVVKYDPETQLKLAFELVQAESHWKDPVDAIIRFVPADKFYALAALIREAVEFYTATTPTITYESSGPRGMIFLVVKAAGYRAGPAGDH